MRNKRQILSNALLVLPATAVSGSLAIEDGRIVDVLPGRRFRDALDLEGRLLVPGVIDIHTDYIEREIAPRPDTRFPLDLAIHYMDLRAVSCGVTTVLSAARVSSERGGILGAWNGDGLQLARAYEAFLDRTKARHLIHIRWDTNFEPVEEALEQVARLKSVGNLVYNENIPGERQFRDVDGLIRRMANRLGVSLEEAKIQFEERAARARGINNRDAVKTALAGKLPLGSHDDTTVEHVRQAHDAGATLAEMPVTIEAAREARRLGMKVCMGAPNYYRGGSHCGNLSCAQAIDEGLVDILCSDYHFPSLLASVVRMARAGVNLAAAIRMVSLNPALYLGLARETGSIETGKSADLVSVEPASNFAAVHHVWVRGALKYQAPEARKMPAAMDAWLEPVETAC